MRRVRLTTAGWMAVVLLVAVDVALVRIPVSGRPVTETLWLLGGLPMANLLVLAAVARFLGGRGGGSSPAFWGFELAGASALLVLLVFALWNPEVLRETLVTTLRAVPLPGGPSMINGMLVLWLPQVMVAMIGRLAARGWQASQPGQVSSKTPSD